MSQPPPSTIRLNASAGEPMDTDADKQYIVFPQKKFFNCIKNMETLEHQSKMEMEEIEHQAKIKKEALAHEYKLNVFKNYEQLLSSGKVINYLPEGNNLPPIDFYAMPSDVQETNNQATDTSSTITTTIEEQTDEILLSTTSTPSTSIFNREVNPKTGHYSKHNSAVLVLCLKCNEPVNSSVVSPHPAIPDNPVVSHPATPHSTELLCQEEFSSEEDLIKHLKNNHSLMKHRCLARGCTESFDEQRELFEHFESHKINKKVFCKQKHCKNNFESHVGLKRHYEINHQEGLYQCIKCVAIEVIFKDIDKHTKKCTKNLENYIEKRNLRHKS